jgi:FkbM family methyltransferase
MGAEATRRMLNKSGVTSYAQSGEDLLAASLLSWPGAGFHVDVGCHHPTKLSNTYLFYLRGLDGVCIDANSEFAKYFRQMRPHDRFIVGCVGEEDGMAEFKVFTDRALSSIGGKAVAGLDEQRYVVQRIERLQIRRVSDILGLHGAPADFELLSIDVEGHDFRALRSAQLDRYRPKLIIIELHDIDLGQIDQHDVTKYCREYGYAPIAAQRSNVLTKR